MCIQFFKYIFGSNRDGYLSKFVNIYTVKIRHSFCKYNTYVLADIVKTSTDKFIIDYVIEEIEENLKNKKLSILFLNNGTIFLYDGENCVNNAINNLLSFYEIIYFGK